MTRFRLWHLKNEMLAANFLANLIGVVLIELFLLRTEGSIPEEFLQHPVANTESSSKKKSESQLYNQDTRPRKVHR